MKAETGKASSAFAYKSRIQALISFTHKQIAACHRFVSKPA
jgi:hypothetical protein